MCDAFGSPGAGDHRAGTHRDAPSLALVPQGVGYLLAGVDDRLDPHPRVGEIERRRIGAVVGGEHHRRAADQHAVAVQERSCAVRQHDSRPVVVDEHDRAFVSAGRNQHVPGADPPHPLTGQPGRGRAAEMVGAPLERQYEAVVVVTERGGALQVPYLGKVANSATAARTHSVGGGAADAFGAAEQRAAGFGLLVDQHHPGAGTRGDQCRGQTRGSGADNEHVGVRMHGVVAGGVGDIGQAALPGDAARGEPVVQLDRRGQQHRLREGRLDLHQTAGILGPCRRNSARAAEFDARRDLVHAVGQQRRGERVTGVAGESTPVEGEFATGAAVDAATGRGAVRGGHEITGLGSPVR